MEAKQSAEPTIFDTAHFIARCPRCNREFPLTSERIDERGCDSGGIYQRDIVCPHCDFSSDVL